VHFDATPSASGTNGVIALSNGPKMSYADYATLVRFFTNGNIDAYNGTDYQAPATAIPYMGGMTYKFRMVVNMTAHTYSAYVTPPGGSEATIGTGMMFRAPQATITSVNSYGVVMQSAANGTISVCGFSVQ
jgi:hypothetical protein